MKSVRLHLIIGVVLTVVGLWMTFDAVQRREWFTAFLSFLLAATFAHSAWKDYQQLGRRRDTA